MASRHINLLRKYQKPILVIMGVILMVTFTVGYSLDTLINSGGFSGMGGGSEDRDPVVVTWVGGKVRQSDLRQKEQLHQIAVNFLRELIAEVVSRGGQPVVNGQTIPKDTPRVQIMQIDPGIGHNSTESSIVGTMLLAKKADELGISVDLQAAREFVESLSIPDVAPEEWREILSRAAQGVSISVDQVLSQIALDLKARHMQMLSQAGLLGVTPGQYWEYHNRLNRRFVVEAYPIDVAGFGAQVQGEPTDAELRAMFDKGKSRDPNPSLAEPGFHQPHKIAFQWLRIDRGPFVEAAMKKITDEEVAKRYELDITQGKHKVIELPPDPTKPVDPAKPTEPAKPGEGAPIDPAKPADSAKPADPAKPSEEQPAAEKPAAEKPADEKPAAEKPAAEKPGEKPAEAEADQKPCSQEQPASEAAQPEEKKPADAPAEKPAEATPNAAKPTDKPAETAPTVTQPGEAPAATTAPETTPPTTAPLAAAPPAAPAPPPKFKPLEEVKEVIRRELAQPIAEDALKAAVKKAVDEISSYGRKYQRWHTAQQAIKDGVKARPVDDPGRLDVEAIAALHGFKSGSTELVDRHEIGNFEIGQKVMEFDMDAIRMGQFRQLSFAEMAFAGDDVPYRPSEPVSSTEPDISYVYWRTAEQAEKVPTFAEAREQLVQAWKFGKAFELAKADAQKLADKAKGAMSLKDVVADPTKVITTVPFSWLTTGSLAFGSGQPSLSTVPGIDLAGTEFMEAVFSLQPGQAGVAPNQSHRTLYVVRVVSQDPPDDVLKEQFLESGLNMQVRMVARNEVLGTSYELFDGLDKEMGLVWERPPIEMAGR
jgi:hypothetical protein